jgi:glycine/D-amino acid oxidase-like deaminating enzyme
MGSSVAYHLLADPAFAGRVVVVEKDPTYALAASALSAASIRQQFSCPVNIRVSRAGIRFLREGHHSLAVDGEAPSFGLHEGGYLYLAGEGGAPTLRANHATQRAEGADVEILSPAALASRFPWLDTSDLALGSFGRSGEGWFDGWALLQGFRRKARALGARFVADEVVGLDLAEDRVAAVRLRGGGRIACGTLVNCAGSNGRRIAAMAGVDLPVVAKRRSVFSFACRTPLPGAPLLIDTSGVWMRPEGDPAESGQLFIAGWSPPASDDPDWSDDDPASREIDWPLFEEVVWPALARRIPALSAIRPGRAWTGPYDMNLFDHNAIVGPAGRPANLLLCNGFSGHGLQQSPAVGRGLAELISHGRFTTLDLADFAFARIAAGQPLRERNVI